jgi:hypothetical protein
VGVAHGEDLGAIERPRRFLCSSRRRFTSSFHAGWGTGWLTSVLKSRESLLLQDGQQVRLSVAAFDPRYSRTRTRRTMLSKKEEQAVDARFKKALVALDELALRVAAKY